MTKCWRFRCAPKVDYVVSGPNSFEAFLAGMLRMERNGHSLRDFRMVDVDFQELALAIVEENA